MDGASRRSAIIDVIVVLVLAVGLVLELAITGLPAPDEGSVSTWRQVLSTLATVGLIASLLVRRRSPLVPLAFAVVAAVAAVGGPVDGSVVLLASIALATYSAGAHADGRGGWIAAAGVAVLVGVALFDPDEPVETAGDVASVTFLVAGPWLAGVALRERRGREALLEQRAEALRRDRAAGEAAAVAEERTRIARELHDVVAHAISVIVLQARGARRSLDTDPGATRTALGTIDEVGTEALAEMRRLVGIARAADERASLQPRPGLAALDGLADQLRGAGMDVAIERTGDPDPLPPGLDLAAFRIVQEALTNALAHGGHGPVLVTVDRARGALELAIVDRGPAVAGPVTEGHGLTGMRERVQLYGGSMETGPLAGGGFGVRVVLPVRPGPGAAS
jgi:signal transduction histidine kinase